MKITRDELNKFYEEFYGEKNALLRGQDKVINKKSKHNVLNLDELNRASNETLQASLQLVLERQIHEHFLPEVDGVRTQIIACTNPEDGDYLVNSFDPALLDRFIQLDVEVDPESWLEWARKNKVNKIVRDFIIDNQSKLHYTPESSEENIGATPRSWEKLARYLDNFDNIPEEMHLNIIRGKIGSSVGSEFYVFYKNYSKNISLEDIKNFITKEYKKDSDFEVIGENLKDYLDDMENISKLEHLNTLFELDDKVINNPLSEMKDLKFLFALLYSLDLEVLTSFLKDKKENSKENFYKLMTKDEGKKLAKRIKSKVQNDK